MKNYLEKSSRFFEQNRYYAAFKGEFLKVLWRWDEWLLALFTTGCVVLFAQLSNVLPRVPNKWVNIVGHDISGDVLSSVVVGVYALICLIYVLVKSFGYRVSEGFVEKDAESLRNLFRHTASICYLNAFLWGIVGDYIFPLKCLFFWIPVLYACHVFAIGYHHRPGPIIAKLVVFSVGLGFLLVWPYILNLRAS